MSQKFLLIQIDFSTAKLYRRPDKNQVFKLWSTPRLWFLLTNFYVCTNKPILVTARSCLGEFYAILISPWLQILLSTNVSGQKWKNWLKLVVQSPRYVNLEPMQNNNKKMIHNERTTLRKSKLSVLILVCQIL